jgi:hypothetical protein
MTTVQADFGARSGFLPLLAKGTSRIPRWSLSLMFCRSAISALTLFCHRFHYYLSPFLRINPKAIRQPENTKP